MKCCVGRYCGVGGSAEAIPTCSADGKMQIAGKVVAIRMVRPACISTCAQAGPPKDDDSAMN